MRILIVVPRAINNEQANYNYLFPLGLAYISSVLKRKGYKVDCLNLNHYDGTVEGIINEFYGSGKEYDFVCTGGISTLYRQVKEIVDTIHKFKFPAGIILGGGLVSSEPELMFRNLNPDYIVISEGEKTIVELLECLERKTDISDVAGIGYLDKKGDFIRNREQTPILDLDALPWPDYEGFEFDKYLNHLRPTDVYFYDLFDYPRAYPIICSRSCPFLCTFCYHPIGNKYRQRSINSIMQELLTMVRRYRINIIAIYDELFSNNREWVYEFCRRMKEFLKELPWECRWGCQMRVDKLDEDILKTMKDSGCYTVSYGFESYSPKILKSMKKFITPQQIDRAVQLTLRNQISLQANFIFGDVAETTQTAEETLNYWKRNSEAGINLSFVNPYPGTKLYRDCIERGIIGDKIDFIANHIFDVLNMSETITHKELEKLKFDIHEAGLRYGTYSVISSFKKNTDGIASIKVKCPHCSRIVEYNNFEIMLRSRLIFGVFCRYCRRKFLAVSTIYIVILKMKLIFYSVVPKVIKVKLYNFAVRQAKKAKAFIRPYILRLRRFKFRRLNDNLDSILQ